MIPQQRPIVGVNLALSNHVYRICSRFTEPISLNPEYASGSPQRSPRYRHIPMQDR